MLLPYKVSTVCDFGSKKMRIILGKTENQSFIFFHSRCIFRC